ncbi:MAG TPA: hypothetical protein VMZ33_04275 [Candidatus Limnocylindrales bacterium]|nr:hypothetical protein [Candidatus Limnocylindrales bacterium]
MLQPELCALVWLLTEKGVPLVVASAATSAAERVRTAFAAQLRVDQPSRDTLPGGVVMAGSLEDVLRVLGGSAIPGSEVADEVRDIGIVLVTDESRVTVAHYVRPVERDGAGHLQRRPPTLLGALDATTGSFDLFYWGYTDELAFRSGMSRVEFEDEHARRTRLLVGAADGDTGLGPSHARH